MFSFQNKLLLIINRFSYCIVLESNETISFQSPPKYTNKKLQQKINEKKNDSQVWLSAMKLTCEDMEIVGYYLLKNNTVKIILFIICSSKLRFYFEFDRNFFENKIIFISFLSN
jgi:hypothetical protein